jgi:hypothetical protein
MMPSMAPLMCNNSTIANLLAAAPNLTGYLIDCGTNATLSVPGIYKFNTNTNCAGTIMVNGENQIIDCQENTIGISAPDTSLLQFRGNGPYIVQNCAFLASNVSQFATASILVSGAVADEFQTIDILIKDTSVRGQDSTGQVGALLRPASGKTMCASVTESDFMGLGIGVSAALASASSQLFLNLLDVRVSLNTFGLTARGSNTELDVKDSLFCSSGEIDFTLQDGAIGSFSNTTCSSTDPSTQKPQICSMSCT